ncbi:MAG: hypothetical protein CM15mP127_08930 [Gammaproteobacteria bacterium]|nr:MAG: hypothetical protein CM15mP127_08930 [Gammaproteobacteria bacterium]
MKLKLNPNGNMLIKNWNKPITQEGFLLLIQEILETHIGTFKNSTFPKKTNLENSQKG